MESNEPNGPSARPAGAPIPGARVVASDDHELGRVGNLHGGYFELDRPGERGFWLSNAHIASGTAEEVRLHVRSSEVDQHRLRHPGLEADRATNATFGEQEFTQQEALATRERMERELLQQRGTIDTGLRHS